MSAVFFLYYSLLSFSPLFLGIFVTEGVTISVTCKGVTRDMQYVLFASYGLGSQCRPN
jgi:hypothetical protein